MTEPGGIADFVAAFDFPDGCRINQRVPKKLLLDNAAATAADKRAINDGIEELFWIAALKPVNIGVPLYRDAAREYLEIAVLQLTMRPDAKAHRLLELVHRSVPYPVLLLTESLNAPEQPGLSAAHKRWSQGEAGKTVLDGELVTVIWKADADAALWSAFRTALALGAQPRTTLHALYQGWIDVLLALEVARRTSIFTVSSTADQAAIRRDALRECRRLEADIATLRAQAVRETQMNRRVDLNLRIRQLEADLARSKEALLPGSH